MTGVIAMKDVNWHSQLTSPVAEHFDLPSSHVPELQRGFLFLQILPGYSSGYRSKRVCNCALGCPKAPVAFLNQQS